MKFSPVAVVVLSRWKLALNRRALLWIVLVALVAALLATLVWLAGRYEVSQVQLRIERDAVDAVGDIRSALTRNVQNLQALPNAQEQPSAWLQDAFAVLREHREVVRLEWRDNQYIVGAVAESPYQVALFTKIMRPSTQAEVQTACDSARRISGPAYSPSHFQPLSEGMGSELIEMCLPLSAAGQKNGFLVVTYALQSMLSEFVSKQISRSQDVSINEADGTRLAVQGALRRGSSVFSATHLLDLPGNTLVLRVDSWRTAPDIFPNVLTALVTLMTLALLSVLVLLGKDIGMRLRAERDLAEALAFRKAMEDSLVTGMRARDLEGRITYVNPAFCQMTGFSAAELVGITSPMPYWPPELANEYLQRQTVRLSGQLPTREGFESMFIRKDGKRFPVLIIEAPLINAMQVQTGWMSAVLDITDQRRMEEQSRASQERLQASARLAMVGEMASLMSHELNQPLAAISSYATGSLNMLGDGSSLSPQDMQHAMQRISEQAERAGKVIKSVHDFVRRRDQTHEAAAPRALFDAIMPLVSLQARKLGVNVQVNCPASIAQVQCDRTMVEQVLLNLARNAMQAMDSAPVHQRTVILAARGITPPADHAGRWIEFSVADQGAGIDESTAGQLFTPFFTTKPEGMGLGLSLCRTVVEQHGGLLTYEPNLPRGTVFKFTLPQTVI